jgi:hypothetical protein
MTDKAISPLRRRLIEDMTIRRLSPNTQHQYIRHVKSFADFVGRSPDKTTAEDVHRYQLHLGSIGTTIPTVNAGASALRFFFKVTLKRRDLADVVVKFGGTRFPFVRPASSKISKILGDNGVCPWVARFCSEVANGRSFVKVKFCVATPLKAPVGKTFVNAI